MRSDLPTTGHSRFQQALASLTSSDKILPSGKGRQPCSKVLKKDTGHHSGLETPSPREVAPCQSTAWLRGRQAAAVGTSCQGRDSLQGLQPRMTGKAMTHKAAETIPRNSLNLLHPQPAPRVNANGLSVMCGENTHSVFLLPRKGKVCIYVIVSFFLLTK